MPRTARIKTEVGMYHIMVRGMDEVPLFRCDDDKDKYLRLIKKYQQLFMFKVYAYCIMTTHAHLIIDCAGADISKFMKSINISYAIYMNKKYNRRGPVFQDRFKSKLITDDKYLIVLSAYIHRNPRDMKHFRDCMEKYSYSSLGIYLGIFKDNHSIVDESFILQYFSNNKSKAKNLYLKFFTGYSDSNCSISDEIEFTNEGSEYRSGRVILVRDYTPEEIIDFISSYIDMPFVVNAKYNHINTELKSVCMVIMRSLCNFTLKEICTVIGNVTQSNVSKLCQSGLTLIYENEKYKDIVNELVKKRSAA